jgi:hypothetical protein
MRLLGDAPCEGNGLLRPAESAGHQGGAAYQGQCALSMCTARRQLGIHICIFLEIVLVFVGIAFVFCYRGDIGN